MQRLNFQQNPYIAIWETTRACDLACLHCRAEAIQWRHPLELTTRESFQLIDQISQCGNPLFVLTGGDPMKRTDLFELIPYAVQKGLRVAMTPSGTPLMTRPVVTHLKQAGLSRLAVSLDGATAEIHDRFRQVSGSYSWTMNCIDYAHEVNLPVQINTTVSRHNLGDLQAIADLLITKTITLWSVFFLVPTGRGRAEDEVSADDYEHVFQFLVDLYLKAPFDIKTTAAPHYRRVLLQRLKEMPAHLRPQKLLQAGPIGRAAGINEGRGFLFVSHTGDIYPSGFLPISAGNVRKDSLIDIYRDSPLFQDLRDTSKLKGKCGDCEFKEICSGSRARAYAMTGDYLAEEPLCGYIPRKTQIRAAGPAAGHS
ncbi:MAG: TIGR04053 family radical SAM/SPASM domain-containing protein [Acidimicrobiia bacterium]|nr:TIGR04053 family radical SAM/SPASM domain-containing protein [Acidimicrobiia bacterium]